MNIAQLYEVYLQHPSVKIDTRKLEKGDLFFALKGTTFNGNAFAEKAIADGAAYAVVDEAQYAVSSNTILVDDVLITLQELAKFHRMTFDIPFLAITGSNGKTTTKELIHAVLSSHYKTYTTEGNLNNQIGIPLTLLKIKDAELAVIEMGANHLHEIESYCLYTQPTHGIITNVGKAHLEGFGSVEGVKKQKGELFDYLRLHEGTAFIMWDYEYLREMSAGIPFIKTFGSMAAEIMGTVKESDPYLQVTIDKGLDIEAINTRLVGSYNFPNVLAAVAIGKYFEIPDKSIKDSIEAYTPSNSRSQLLNNGSNKIILDAYNANPSSMRSAVENFMHMQGTNKILILGAMAELGTDSIKEHQAIIALIASHRWKKVVLVGGDFVQTPHSYLSFNSSKEAGIWYKEQGFTDCTILIKGSRSMQMEKILE